MSTPRRRRRPLHALTAAGLAVDVGVVVVDLLTPGFDLPIAPLVVAPLLPASAGLLTATTVLAALSLVLAVLITREHGSLDQTDELVRLGSIAIAFGLIIAGARLRRRVGELVQALDALPDAVTIQDPTGAVLYGNRAAAALVGGRGGISKSAAAEYLERMIVTDEAGAPLDPASMPAQRLLAGASAEPVVVKSVDPATGDVTWTRVQASPLRDAGGRMRSAVNVIEDITAVKRAEERSAFLADASALLSSSLDTTLTLQRTAQLVVPVLADWCSVDLVVPGRGTELAALAHAEPEKVLLGRDLLHRYPRDLSLDYGLGHVLRTGEPQLFAEISPALLERYAVDAEHLAMLQAIGFSSLLVVPLAIGPRVIGALTWVAVESRRRYGPEDLRTASELADRAAVAVENARVHSARVEIATVLQEALLPPALPTAPGWELAEHYRAAGEANEVGGDFYDVVVLEDGALLALIGDVAGKGARAAALTAQTRHTIVAAASLEGGDPEAGLSLLNAALQAENRFELCSVVVLVVRGDQLTVISAGHPLPLLRRGDELQELGATSPMLGVAPVDSPWAATTTTLRAGDLVMLHTDGITDAVGATERFGAERLASVLRTGPADARATIERVVAAVDAFEEGPQADDRALLALRRTV